jgi:homoserine O-acetyltransferase
MGLSMGGMQTFEWMVSYPDYMDNAIPIEGTPKQSFYDILLCQAEASIILQAKKEKQDMRIAMQRIKDINILHDFTPHYLSTTQSPDSVNAFLAKEYKIEYNADNYLSQVQAMNRQDIYKSSGRLIEDIKNLIRCKVFVIVTTQDLFVNPLNAVEFAKANNYKLVELSGDFGHVSPFFKAVEIKQAIIEFLK